MGAPAIAGRRTDRALFVFYAVVALIALAGQSGAAVQWLRWWLPVTVVAVAAVEFGGIVLSVYADYRRRLGEHAFTARVLSAAVAVGAVAVNWLGHIGHLKGAGFFVNHLQGGFFAGMSALGYGVWLLHSGARRRDQLRAEGDLPPVAPVYGLWAWLRQPGLTRRARALALANPKLGLYGSLDRAREADRVQRRQAAISGLLRRKLAAGRDPLAAEIAVTVYDLDVIAARLADRADYDGLTDLIAADLTPDRIAAPDMPAPADPASVPLSAHVPPVALSAVRLAVADTAAVTEVEVRDAHSTATTGEVPAEVPPAATATSAPTKPRTSPRTSPRKTATSRRAKTATSAAASTRRSTAQTRELAAQLRTQHPDIGQAELAQLLGISSTRLRQVERPVNGTEVAAT